MHPLSKPTSDPQARAGRAAARRRNRLAATAALLVSLALPGASFAQDTAEASAEQQVESLVPKLEAYIEANMQAFDVPGLAIGIVAGGELVYAKGFGVRSVGGPPVDTDTVFQIGSATKAFLAATLAIAVDRGKLAWDDRVVDVRPDFQLYDPWVTREFRIFDLLAQRSSLPPYANDMLGFLGYDRPSLVRSLRHVEPVSSFRSTFAYTNITHVLAGEIVAEAEGAADWTALVEREILDPLGMAETSTTREAIEAAANHAEGYGYRPDGSVPVPFDLFPYGYDGAGAINSTIEDMAKWVGLQLAGGIAPDGMRIVSAENLTQTHTPKVAITDKLSYALGWVVQQTPNGAIVWHNGGTPSFGALVALQLDRKLGIVVLSNQSNVGMPDAVGLWAMDRLLGNPEDDHAATALARARSTYADNEKQFARPAAPEPSPPLAPLAGRFDNPSFGRAELRADAAGAVLELAEIGAQLRVDPWNGPVYTLTLLPEGRFAATVANAGPLPVAFAQFEADSNGQPATLRLTFSDGQAYDFARETPEP